VSEEAAGLRNREAAWELAQQIEDPHWRELVTLSLGAAIALRIRRPTRTDDEPFDLLFFVEALRALGEQEVAEKWLARGAKD
jgi:hypothetical protein